MSRGSQLDGGRERDGDRAGFLLAGAAALGPGTANPSDREWAKALHEREPRHSASSWDAKIRDVLSCLPIPTVKSYAGRPAGSVRRIKDGAKGPTVEGEERAARSE